MAGSDGYRFAALSTEWAGLQRLAQRPSAIFYSIDLFSIRRVRFWLYTQDGGLGKDLELIAFVRY
jgi:hypothetical protein